MDLVIALEMSRLQLIEDEVRKQHRANQPGTSSELEQQQQQQPSSRSAEEFSEEAQLRLAIHLSLEESRRNQSATEVDDASVDTFMKSLTKHELKNFYLESDHSESKEELKSWKTLFGKEFFFS